MDQAKVVQIRRTISSVACEAKAEMCAQTYAANLLFMAAVGMAYQCLAPIVAGVCAAILWLWFYVRRLFLLSAAC